MSTTLFNGLKVNLRVSDKTPLGFTVLINDEHEGLLYHNEIFKPIIVGQNIVGYIKQIRPDGKIDVTLQQQGYLNITDNYQILIDLLEQNNGIIPIGDKSSPEKIQELLGVSKKTFKKMAGLLFKQQKISVSDFEIRLTNKK
jgi:predicted RNA-binding protein (virulence factor B family)